ncbi:MAG: KH domain-containing protein [Desulfobacterales bacterium]|nr:KH domain-containing protein [Desulfobacterales bacterium]
MSSEVEFTGRTVEKAVENACQHLDIEVNNLDYAVVKQGSTGFFGIFGGQKATIKVLAQEKQTDSIERSPDNRYPFGDEEAPAATPENLTAAARAGREAVEMIANSITAGASVVTKDEGKRVFYDITGGKAGVLIGKRGQTLEAIQYLVEKVVNRKTKERVRVSIDVGGYLAKKRRNLEGLAEQTAKNAKKSGKATTLGRLNAHDRRIIHLALKDDDGVTTKSIGNGFLRKLLVLPKKRRSSPKRRP